MLESGPCIRRRTLVQAFALSASLLAAPALRSQSRLEKTRIGIAVPGKGELHYLPLTIAEQLGYFKAKRQIFTYAREETGQNLGQHFPGTDATVQPWRW